MNGETPPSQQATSAQAARAGAMAVRAGGAGAVGTSEATAAELAAFFRGLLERQCALVGGAAGVIYLSGSEARPGGIAATYERPKTGSGNGSGAGPARVQLDEALRGRLARLGADVASRGEARAEGLTLEGGEGGAQMYHGEATHTALAHPLAGGGQTHGASVIVTSRGIAGGQERALLATLALTVSQYEAFLWQQHCVAEAHAKTRLRETLELLDAAQKGADAPSMGGIFCHELARRFGCTRVSVGLVRGRSARMKLAAVSGADELEGTGAAAEALESAMEECADQDIEIVYPPPALAEGDPSQRRVTRAHEELSRRYGPSAILSLPLRVEGDLVGVVTMERDAADPFPMGAAALLRLVAEYIGPALWTRRMADRGILAVARDRVVDVAVAAVGPRHTGVKALVSMVVLGLAGMAAIPIPDRVSGDAEAKADLFRIIPAPFPGRLSEVFVKPGDDVTEGQVLGRMDVRDMQLELARTKGERARMQAEYDAFLAERDVGRATIVAARMEELTPQIELLEHQIADAAIVAPIGGQVSRGDNEKLLGAVVDPTTPLFEVVSLEEMVVVIEVGERDIARLSESLARRAERGVEGEGAEERVDGWFAPSSNPGVKLPLVVETIRPSAEAVRGANVFVVEARLTDEGGKVEILPGMTGTARLKAGLTTPLVTVLRPLLDEARLRLWW